LDEVDMEDVPDRCPSIYDFLSAPGYSVYLVKAILFILLVLVDF